MRTIFGFRALSYALALFSAGSAYGAAANFTVTGSIPSNTSVSVSGLDGSNSKQIFSTVTGSQFDAGEIVITDAIQLRSLRTNTPVYLKIAKTAWTLPAAYDTTNGPKKTDGSDSTFLLQVNTSTLSTASGVIGAEGTFGSAYTAVTNTPAQFLKLGDVTGVNRRGASNGSADLNAKILLNPVYDVPGTYIVDIEVTVVAQP